MSESKLLADSSFDLQGVQVERDDRSLALIELIVTGTGALTATAQLYGSVNGSVEVDLGTITATGTNSAVAIDTIELPYRLLRCVLSNVTGTNARAICTHSSV